MSDANAVAPLLGAPSFDCLLCGIIHRPNNVATTDTCSHRYCFGCIYRWATSREGTNTCPLCRETIKFIFVDDQTFRVPQVYTNLTVEVGGGRFVYEQFPVRTYKQMLQSLERYKEWLSSERGYDEEVCFAFRGEILGSHHKLKYFTNVREGEVVQAIVRCNITFQYVGTRVDKYCLGISGMTNNSISTFESKFKNDYFDRVGSSWDVEFEYFLNGTRLLALGDYSPPLIDMNGQVIIARENGYKLGRY